MCACCALEVCIGMEVHSHRMGIGFEWEWGHNNMGVGAVNGCRVPKSFPRIS